LHDALGEDKPYRIEEAVTKLVDFHARGKNFSEKLRDTTLSDDMRKYFFERAANRKLNGSLDEIVDDILATKTDAYRKCTTEYGKYC